MYEANITNLFTNGIILELNARNIDNPMRKIYMEQRYKSTINARCDIYLDFSSFICDNDFIGYSVKSKSWIEAKYFGGINRNKEHETKSENAGSIIYDIYIFIKLIYSEGNVDHAKYSINVYNDAATKYLAFSRQDGSIREWVRALTSYGIVDLRFNLAEGPHSIQKLFKDVKVLVMNIKLKNVIFEPVGISVDKVCFYGYLNQILSYKINIDNIEYEY